MAVEVQLLDVGRMNNGTHVVAISGGKDSTALALRLAEVEPRDYVYVCTPTGNELPSMVAHWDRLEAMLGAPINRITNRDLEWWIAEQRALPNFRMRWCTRVLKIEPCQAFMLSLPPPVTLYVGLRADEPEREGVAYGGAVTERYPLREWSWSVSDVRAYLRKRGVEVPSRTDCAWCYHQRIDEWWTLWKEHPASFAKAVATEAETGHTFRTPGRDSWPTSLAELAAAFTSGKRPKAIDQRRQLPMFAEDDTEAPCRVCTL